MLKKIVIISMLVISIVWAEVATRIINGTQVSSTNEEWRSIVSLKWQNRHYCGGTLIAPTWVLTAAHCLVNSSGQVYIAVVGDTVGIGSYNLNTQTSVDVKQFIVHPSYSGATNDNDIGLVELSTAVTIVTPTAYDTSHSLATNTQSKSAGWGNMSTTSNLFPQDLREALLPLVDTSICNSSFSYNGSITVNMLCAGYIVSTRDSCQGDSGGPLIVDKTLIGIVSWGNACAKTSFPGVYVKVQNYKTWIKSYVPYEVPKTSYPVLVPIISAILND